MPTDPNSQALIAKHRSTGLFLDTNLLLLFIVGVYNRRRIENFKRTARYLQSDFQRIAWFTSQFSLMRTTPNVLTEADNLGRQLPMTEWPAFAAALAKFASTAEEIYLPSAEATVAKGFERLGLTDTTTIALNRKFLILTDDLPLSIAAQRAGLDAINYNHIRN